MKSPIFHPCLIFRQIAASAIKKAHRSNFLQERWCFQGQGIPVEQRGNWDCRRPLLHLALVLLAGSSAVRLWHPGREVERFGVAPVAEEACWEQHWSRQSWVHPETGRQQRGEHRLCGQDARNALLSSTKDDQDNDSKAGPSAQQSARSGGELNTVGHVWIWRHIWAIGRCG